MNPKLLEILKKAKQVDQRAKKLDSTNTTTLDSNIQSRQNSMPPSGGMVTEQPMNTPTMELPTSRPQPKVDVNSQSYKDKVKESGLPPEIMKAMLDNPIEQPDAPGTFSMNEEAIKEVNPSYGKPVSNTITKAPIPPTSNKASLNVNNGEIRKMIAEEIAKALPSIVEKYFDKKMIRENIEVLKALKVKKKTTNNRK
tara:strand:- start:1796 stop:2386 length:591 start_codon:yes stop_codon:yes gene_type:complete